MPIGDELLVNSAVGGEEMVMRDTYPLHDGEERKREEKRDLTRDEK